MRFRRSLLLLMLVALLGAAGQVRAVALAGAEYFVGSDPGEGLGTAIDPALLSGPTSAQTLQSLVVSAVPTAAGVVTLGVRVRDDAGRWSNPLLRRLIIRQVGALQAVLAPAVPAGLALETLTAGDPATVLLADQPVPGFATVSAVTRPLASGVGNKAFQVRARSLAEAQLSNSLTRTVEVREFPALAPILPQALASRVVLELLTLPEVGQTVAIRLGGTVLETAVLAGDSLESLLQRWAQQLAATPTLASQYQASVSQGRLTLETTALRGWREGETTAVAGNWRTLSVLQGSAAATQRGLARLEWREGETEVFTTLDLAQNPAFAQTTLNVGSRSLSMGNLRYRVRAISSASEPGTELERVLRVREIPPLAAITANAPPSTLLLETFTGADPGLGAGQAVTTSASGSFVQAGPVSRALSAGLGVKNYGVRAFVQGAEEGSTVLYRRVDVQPLPPLQPIQPDAFASWVAWTLSAVPSVGDLLALRLGGESVSVLALEGDTPQNLLQRWLQAAQGVGALTEAYQFTVNGNRLDITTLQNRGWRDGEYEWVSGSLTQVGLRQGSGSVETSGIVGLRLSGDALGQPQEVAVSGVSGFVQTTVDLGTRRFDEGVRSLVIEGISGSGVVGEPSQRRILVRQMPTLATVAPAPFAEELELQTLEITESGETQIQMDAALNAAPGLILSAGKTKGLAAGAGVKTYAVRAQTRTSGQASSALLRRVLVRPAPQLEPVQPLALSSLLQLGFSTVPVAGTNVSFQLAGEILALTVSAGQTVAQILEAFATQIQQSATLNARYNALASADALRIFTREARGWREGEWQALSPEWQVARVLQGQSSTAQQGLARLELEETVEGVTTVTEWDLPSQPAFAQVNTLELGHRPAGRPVKFRLRAVGASEVAGEPLEKRMTVQEVAPLLVAQPVSPGPVNPGASYRVSVQVANSLPLTYVWKKDGVALEGQTTRELYLAAVTSADVGVYRVEISNALGTVTSDAVTLSLNEPVVITAQPIAQTLRVGDPLQLSVTATGTAPIQYQWRKDGVPIAEATGAVFAIPGVSFTDAGSYDVVITNVVGSVTSASVAVTVERLPQSIVFAPIPDQLTTQTVPLSATGGNSGNPVTFAVTAGPGVIVNQVLAFTTSGTVTVTASQEGNTLYQPAAVSRTFTVTKASALVELGLLNQFYTGTPRVVSVTTTPVLLPVVVTYAGSLSPPTNPGSYEVVATVDDPIYQGSATGTLEIGKALQVINFVAIADQLTTDSVNLTATGGGSGNPVIFAVSSGPGVITNNVLTFTTSGSVTVTASQAGNANYLAATNVSQTFTVSKASAPVTLASLAQTYTGAPRAATATTEPAGLTVNFTYDGSSMPPTHAGSYAVVATVNDLIYQGSAIGTLEIGKANATLQFAELLHIHDGSPRSVSFTSDPEALPYDLLYAGFETAPSLPGSYAVTASLDHPLYTGSGSATLTILGLSGRDQRLPSGSSQPQEANGTDFGRVMLGRVATQTFTLTNPGTTPVALTGSPRVEILGDHAGDFQVTATPSAVIPAGDSVSFEVRFAPTQPGARQAVVSLACEALANGPITFAVGGFGALPTLLAQSISFNLPASLFQSQGPVPLLAAASSGLPVSLTLLSGPATLANGQLSLTGPGTVKVEARQEGGGNFAPANPVVRTLTVKVDPTGLTLADLTQTYNGTPRPITVLGTEEEAMVSYLVNGVSTPQAPTLAGSYPVRVTAGGVTKTGVLVIARAPLIVQVEDQRKLVGQPNPDFGLRVSGWVGSDTEETADWLRPIALTTKAKVDSPPGLYPITSSGGMLANYTLIHRPGTLVVEGYVGNFEALLRDPNTGLPVGLLKLTVPSTSQSLTASLALADEAKPLALAGPLELDPQTRVASARLSRAVNATTNYRLDLSLSLFGELAVEVRKNNALVARAENGTRLRDAVKGETLAQAGAYTAVLEPAENEAAPSAPGWATGRVDSDGTLELAGRLGDGTSFTASLPVDVSDDYRLFLQPYKRAGAFMAGAWTLTEHPKVEGAWQVRDAELIWEKGTGDKDPGYRAGFGPLAVSLQMDAWQPASKTSLLAQLLGAQRLEFAAETTGSPSETQLPARMAVEANGVLRVLAPTNARKWVAKVNPATGAYSGSFELLDGTLKRKVSFGGVLRQSADVGVDGLQGCGHYLLPPLKGALSTESTTGWVEFRRE